MMSWPASSPFSSSLGWAEGFVVVGREEAGGFADAVGVADGEASMASDGDGAGDAVAAGVCGDEALSLLEQPASAEPARHTALKTAKTRRALIGSSPGVPPIRTAPDVPARSTDR